MKNIHTLSQLPIKGKKVLLRVDFNVPLSPEGKITDDTRIREALPTIRYIFETGRQPYSDEPFGTSQR